jgi:dTDP-3-amino-3,4,6-trideoxy-alpha-D-glucose transaminase
LSTAAPAQATQVPFTRLDGADPELLEELLAVVTHVAQRGAFTLGEEVEDFERDFAAFCESEFAVGVSSGTEALALSLRALEIGPGDQVMLPTNSFIATAEAVSAVGATPLLVDVDPQTHLIDAQIVAAAITPKVRCVIPVHLYGATVEMTPILQLAQERGIHVLEDACQAHGAFCEGRRAGSLGTLGCFSFYPTKNLGGWGDGGAVVTSDPRLTERVRLLRSHGEQPRYRHRIVGATARLDALQAAILRRKLQRLEGWTAQRRFLAGRLRRLLGDLAPVIELPAPAPGGDHVHHLFVVRCRRRDALREHLSARGVASAIHYPTPIHLTEAYASLGFEVEGLPASEDLARQICSLPMFPGMTEGELARVADAVTEFAEGPSPRNVGWSG